jgi:hypothetical protein
LKKWLILLGVAIALGSFTLYAIVTTPTKLKRVELIVKEKHGNWKVNIGEFVFSLFQSGQTVTPQLIEELKEEISELPWVEKCKVEAKGSEIKIEVWETKPALYLFYNGQTYTIGDNDFVLGAEPGVARDKKPLFFFSGKESPFTVENGFLKLKKTVKMEIKLAEEKVKRLEGTGEPPKVLFTDTGVVLALGGSKVLVYLSPDADSWNNFEEFRKAAGHLSPNVYDFRFHDMLIKGRQAQCSKKKR